MRNCDRSGQRDEVAEREPGDEQRRREDDEAEDPALRVLGRPPARRTTTTCQRITGSARATAAQKLTITEITNGSATPNVAGFLCSVGQRRVQPVEDLVVEDVRDDERGPDRDQAVEESRAQLAEVLDERRLLAGRKPPRNDPAHGR